MPSAARLKTRERILDAALQGVARHGLGKLGMGDVSTIAGVSRGTLYRYFPSREELLAALSDREAERFRRRLEEAVAAAESDAQRLQVALEYATALVREHPLLQRVLETDAARVLEAVRERLPEIRALIRRLVAPIFDGAPLVRDGVITTDQLVDWTTRVMISAFLFPDPEPKTMTDGMISIYVALIAPDDEVRS